MNSRIKQLRHRLSLAQSENQRISELLAKNACEAERLATERNACESRVQAARLAVNEIGFDVAEYERVQSQLRVCFFPFFLIFYQYSIDILLIFY